MGLPSEKKVDSPVGSEGQLERWTDHGSVLRLLTGCVGVLPNIACSHAHCSTVNGGGSGMVCGAALSS